MSTATERFARIAERFAAGEAAGIASVCSAHPLVIEATLRHGLAHGSDVLIEATCNQVNQDGGYTGMTPADFRRFVEGIAATVGFPPDRLVLGGDHLGPNPWKALSPGEAMDKAEVMIAAFTEAGFTKLHLDTSMGCAGEPIALSDEVVAERAARLAGAAERVAAERAGGIRPVYVVGTEVPVPGGALEALDHLAVTTPAAARQTIEVHRRAFAQAGLDEAFGRAVAAVVQPGVEFGNAEVVVFEPKKAASLSATLRELPGFVFEAHSTDYQPTQALRALVQGGFVILKVGPWLTFALREALYGLSAVADILAPDDGDSLPWTMERVMLASPDNWRKYYPGDEAEQRIERHYSFSDRIRYYWPESEARAAVDRLLERLGDRPIPLPLISQHLGQLYASVEAGTVEPNAHALLLASVTRVLDIYGDAIRQ